MIVNRLVTRKIARFSPKTAIKKRSEVIAVVLANQCSSNHVLHNSQNVFHQKSWVIVVFPEGEWGRGVLRPDFLETFNGFLWLNRSRNEAKHPETIWGYRRFPRAQKRVKFIIFGPAGQDLKMNRN